MTELSFAKSFLSLLDSRPQKRPADYMLPASELEITTPYTLPRMPQSMRKPTSTGSTDPASTTNDSSSPPTDSVTLTLKSTRNPVLSLTLPSTNVSTTSILELKERVAKHLQLKDGVGKVRILHARKPVPDSRTVREVLGGEEGVAELAKAAPVGQLEVELGVMIMGYKAEDQAPEGMAEPGGVAAGTGAAEGEEDGEGEAFWSDLKGFLLQRVKDEKRAEEMHQAFRSSWKGR